MADIKGVGKKITYSEDNPITAELEEFRKKRDAVKREPKDDEERERLARWLRHRGRDEPETTVGTACYASSHFEMDCEWRYFLAEHIGTEAGHGGGSSRQAKPIAPPRHHRPADHQYGRQYGLTPRFEHHQIMKRDFLSYIFSGNLWPYGHCTAVSIQSIQITTPKLLDFEERVVHAEERSHHDAILQKIHDYVWGLIEVYGEGPIRARIAWCARRGLK